MDGLAGVGALLAGGGLAGVELLFRPKWLIVRQLLRAWGTRLLVVGVLFGVVLLVLPAAVAELRAELAGTGVLARTVRWVLDHTGQPAATTASGKTRLSEALALLNTLGIGTALLGVLRAVLRREQSRLVTLAAWVAVPLALTSGFLLLVNDASAVGATGGGWRRLGVAAVLLALLEAFGNLTNWSMHPFYKRRLSSAFMLHRPADGKAEPISYERRTHFRRELSKRGPQLVVCAAANVSDVGVTPPGRSALSFTFTREAIGCPTASIPTEALDTRFGKRARDFTLAAAIAVSGAAISPSMGKMTRRSYRFLLALANVRLGVWLPNPIWVQGWSTTQTHPRLRFQPRPDFLLREMLRVDLRHAGPGGRDRPRRPRRGHRHRPHPDAAGLGDQALWHRPCHRPLPLPRQPGAGGHLVYAKTAVTGGAPWDVLAYAEHDPVFPYTSTAYQRFDERSFEAYRALGTYTAQRAAEALQHHLASWPHRRMPGAPEAVAAARTPGLGGQPAPGMAPAEPAAAGTSQGLNGEPAAGGSLSTP